MPFAWLSYRSDGKFARRWKLVNCFLRHIVTRPSRTDPGDDAIGRIGAIALSLQDFKSLNLCTNYGNVSGKTLLEPIMVLEFILLKGGIVHRGGLNEDVLLTGDEKPVDKSTSYLFSLLGRQCCISLKIVYCDCVRCLRVAAGHLSVRV